ncbi:MAG: hypothetical protein R3C32_12665 [Chloroflexota bacterium]
MARWPGCPTVACGSPRSARDGLVLVDAPDIDSVEHDNPGVGGPPLLERADLCVFAVTVPPDMPTGCPGTSSDRSPSARLPLLVVVNRMPEDPLDQARVLDDAARLLEARPCRRSGS